MTLLFCNPSIMEAKDRRIKEIEQQLADTQAVQEAQQRLLRDIEQQLADARKVMREALEYVEYGTGNRIDLIDDIRAKMKGGIGMSETPRTDAALESQEIYAIAKESRQLERELAEARKDIENETKYSAGLRSSLDEWRDAALNLEKQLAEDRKAFRGFLLGLIADCNEDDEFTDKSDIKRHAEEELKAMEESK
jgi:septal ring factor EnvC (AmiA/AmiB activator)